MNYELIGWVGGLMLAVCALPQAVMAYKQGHSNGISLSMLFLWGIGEIFTLVYVMPKSDWPLIINYATNILCIGVIAWFRFYPREEYEKVDEVVCN